MKNALNHARFGHRFRDSSSIWSWRCFWMDLRRQKSRPPGSTFKVERGGLGRNLWELYLFGKRVQSFCSVGSRSASSIGKQPGQNGRDGSEIRPYRKAVEPGRAHHTHPPSAHGAAHTGLEQRPRDTLQARSQGQRPDPWHQLPHPPNRSTGGPRPPPSHPHLHHSHHTHRINRALGPRASSLAHRRAPGSRMQAGQGRRWGSMCR